MPTRKRQSVTEAEVSEQDSRTEPAAHSPESPAKAFADPARQRRKPSRRFFFRLRLANGTGRGSRFFKVSLDIHGLGPLKLINVATSSPIATSC